MVVVEGNPSVYTVYEYQVCLRARYLVSSLLVENSPVVFLKRSPFYPGSPARDQTSTSSRHLDVIHPPIASTCRVFHVPRSRRDQLPLMAIKDGAER